MLRAKTPARQPAALRLFLDQGGIVTPHAARPKSQDVQTEEYVASLYRALGYRVRRDVLIDGNQIDLVATTNLAGYGPIAMIVEVKFRSGGAVGKNEVLAFANVAKPILAQGVYSRATLVSTTGFTRFAKAAASSVPGVALLSLEDLERSLLPVGEPLLRYLDTYRAQPINHNYIDVTVKLIAIHPKHGATPPEVTSAVNLLQVASTWADSAVIVFADYGGGKTTALQRMKALAADAAVRDPEAAIPILFTLKDFGENRELNAFVHDTLQRELGFTVPSDVFWNLLSRRRFLLLLDGLDEVTLRVDRDLRADLLRRLSPLLFGRSPSILTTRPSYFATADEYGDALRRLSTAGDLQVGPRGHSSVFTNPNDPALWRFTESLRRRYQPAGSSAGLEPSYISYNLELLTSEQIDGFLARYAADFVSLNIGSPSDVREFIDSVYDLSDLTRRPLLLDMIVASLLQGQIDLKDDRQLFGPAKLYEAYTAVKLALDWDRSDSRRSSLSTAVRRNFAEACAQLMHDNDVLEIDQDQVLQLIRSSAGTANLDEEAVITDLRTCSFLTLSEYGALRFIHKSFQEFFLARHIKTQFDTGNLDPLSQLLPYQVLYFLGGFAFSDPEFRLDLLTLCLKRRVRRQGLEDSRTNASAAALLARDSYSGLHWENFEVGPVRRDRLELLSGRFKSIKFRSLAIGSMEFVGSQVDGSVVADDIQGLSLTSCSGKLSLDGTADTIAVSESELTISLRCECSVLTLSGGDVVLELERAPGVIRVEHGACTLQGAGGTVDAEQCRLKLGRVRHDPYREVAKTQRGAQLGASDRFAGKIVDARVTILEPWGWGGACVRSIAHVVSNRRRSSAVRLRRFSSKGSLLLIDPGLVVDQVLLGCEDTLVLGGEVEFPDAVSGTWTGVVFAAAKARSSGGPMRVVAVGPRAYVVGGGRDEVKRALHALDQLIQRMPAIEGDPAQRMAEELPGLLSSWGLPSEIGSGYAEKVTAMHGRLTL